MFYCSYRAVIVTRGFSSGDYSAISLIFNETAINR